MSGIVLSASVRQNLLSLQSTAELLSTTQNRLATGKKVNTALDNPTNFFTAASLDNRASDINNLLDGISNGVQVLQAANTGITSLQKLVDSAKSVANQALQAPGRLLHQDQPHQRRERRRNGQPTCSAPACAGRRPDHRSDWRRHGIEHHVRYGRSRVDTLAELNTALAANNLAGFGQRHLTGAITITTTNDAASATIGSARGTATWRGQGVFRPLPSLRGRQGRGCYLSDDACEFGGAVQQHHRPDHHHGAGRVLQRHQSAQRRSAQADLQRDRQVDADYRGRDFNYSGSRPSTLTAGTDFLDNARRTRRSRR